MNDTSMAVLSKLNVENREWGWYKIDRSLSSDGVFTDGKLKDILQDLVNLGFLNAVVKDGHTIFSITLAGIDYLRINDLNRNQE